VLALQPGEGLLTPGLVPSPGLGGGALPVLSLPALLPPPPPQE
jgi:hypothetical protein